MEKLIIDNETLKRTIRRLSYEIIEKNKSLDNVCLIGIKTKGINLCDLIKENIKAIEGVELDTGSIDISPFRDDIETDVAKEVNEGTVLFDVVDKIIILVDDVLYTGRTIRAAMDAVIELGRPLRIELLVLIDRGHRELPIRANYIGKNIPTSKDELIKVSITDLSGNDHVIIKR